MKAFTRGLFYTIIPVVFLACMQDNSNKNQAADQYVNREIGDRISKIKAYNSKADTVLVNPDEVDKKVNDIILMSKDVENLSASVSRGNQYFSGLSVQYKINSSDFNKVNAGMHINDIASILKQNEMVFFNHLLLKTGSAAFELHTAN